MNYDRYMALKVFVTGATGFIGQHALPLLRAQGFEIHAPSSRELNLFDFSQVKRAMAAIRPTHLLHLAWVTTPGKYWDSPDNLAWVEASLHLASTFALHGGKRLVVAGTCAEYDWNQSHFSEKSSQFKPATLYGTCKRSLFQILESFCAKSALSFAWGYVFYPLGPKDRAQRFLPSLIRSLLQQKKFPCTHGNQLKDFLDVRDVADAFSRLLEASLEGAINIGSGRAISLKSVVNQVSQLLDRHDLVAFGALPTNEPKALIADTTRLSTELRWQPKFPIYQTLKEVIAQHKKI
jgi:nucleoside-diphosphate-sugar epimerase